MPRRSILSAAERESLLALPDTKDELIRHYTFSESDLSICQPASNFFHRPASKSFHLISRFLPDFSAA